MKYRIVESSLWGSSPVADLERQVNELIIQGWRPLGSVCHSFQTGCGARGQTMSQAMILEELANDEVPEAIGQKPKAWGERLMPLGPCTCIVGTMSGDLNCPIHGAYDWRRP